MANRKAIVPIISIILLLMMAIAAAAVTFYWLNKMQGTMQGGTDQYQEKSFERMASTVGVASLKYNQTSENITIYLQNIGTTTIPVDNSTTDPTGRLELSDANDNVICSEKLSSLYCVGCGNNLDPQEVQSVRLALAGTNCDLSNYGNESAISLNLYLSGKATASTVFVIKSSAG